MKKTRLYLSVLLFVIGICQYQAQHNAIVSQYMFNMYSINPAYAGAKDYSTVNAFYRAQWVGFEGAPRTQTITFHRPISKKNLGIGAQIFNDQIGVTKELGILGSVAYNIKMDKRKLSLGLSAGFKNFTSSWTALRPGDEGDINFSYDTQNRFRPEFGIGAYYQGEKWYLGFSIPYLFNTRISENNENINTYYDAKNTNYLATAGMAFELNRNFVLKPSVLIKANPASAFQIDLNTNLIVQNRFWFGVSYRLQDALIAMFEVQANEKLKIGYSYDFTLSDIQQYAGGSHEFSLEYVIGRKPSIVNPRFAPKLYF